MTNNAGASGTIVNTVGVFAARAENADRAEEVAVAPIEIPYEEFTLPNGLRVVTERMPGLKSASIGICRMMV